MLGGVLGLSSLHCRCFTHYAPAPSAAPPLRGKATTTLRTEQMPDGSWCAHMLVTGLPNERAADAAMEHMQRLFCGEEIKSGH